MRIEYFPETDSLYIDLAERPGTDTVEIGDGIVLDIDADTGGYNLQAAFSTGAVAGRSAAEALT